MAIRLGVLAVVLGMTVPAFLGFFLKWSNDTVLLSITAWKTAIIAASALVILIQFGEQFFFSIPELKIAFLIREDGETLPETWKLSKGEKNKLIYFWMEDIGIPLKNLSVWVTLPKELKIHSDPKEYEHVEWKRVFKYQEWHNCLFFPGADNYMTLSRGMHGVYPIVIDAPGTQGSFPISIAGTAENTARAFSGELRIIVE